MTCPKPFAKLLYLYLILVNTKACASFKYTTSRRMILTTDFYFKFLKIWRPSFSVYITVFECLIKCFLLENICHCQEQFGYEVFGHFSVSDDVIGSSCKFAADTAVEKVVVVLGAKKVKYCEASEFRNECSEYFERYYKILAMQAPLVLPSDVPTKFKGIVNTMSRWCQSIGNREHVKGFVLHSFLIKELYFKMYNNRFDDLRRKLNIEDFPSSPTITVYNPTERVFFLVRVAESKDIENEIKLCGAELKMLLLLVGDELKNTGIKVIPLVVTDKESICTDCRSYLIPREEIEHIDLFTSWYEQKSVGFDIVPADCFDKNKANEIFAKIVSCMGAAKVHDFIPAFTTEEEKQMKQALVLLTPEQVDILLSEEKHVIVSGPYGSGKSIIARIKAKMIADNLPESELLYYVSYDSRSALLNEIQKGNPNIKIYPDKEELKGTKLSDMIIDILKENKMEKQPDKENIRSQKKINLIIDEYDGEHLDQSEARKLNSIINKDYKKVFEDAVILLIAQSMKKERWVRKNSIDSNRFDLLEKMQKKKLSLVMRNSTQIHNLREVTEKILEDVRTRYELQEKENVDWQQQRYGQQVKEENNQKNNETVITNTQTSNSISEIPQDSEIDLISSMAQFGALNIELDEAFDYAEIPAAKDDDETKIENRFEYEKAAHIGHGGQSKLPVLFELCRCDSEFQKIISLTAIFEDMQITKINANVKHVLLHFNADNEVPRLAIKLLDLKHNTKVTDKLTNSYEDFKNDSLCKYIFVCNFRTFRGLEHSRITIIIDRDIYSLQHFFVECIARCTTYLNVVSLGDNKTLNIITQTWKQKFRGKSLIEKREIILSTDRKQSKDADIQKNEDIVIDTFSQQYKTLQQTFNKLLLQKNEGEVLVSKQKAKRVIQT